MKVMIMTDNPNIPTGMGRVGKELALGLQKRGYNVSYLGWFTPPWFENKLPIRLHKTNNNYYGADVFDDVVTKEQPDVVITVGDVWMIRHIKEQARTRQFFKWIGYTPIDGHAWHGGVPNSWIEVFESMDKVVAYTEYGKRKILHSIPELVDDIRVIPHGVDTKVFYPLPEEQIKKYRSEWGIGDAFIFLMVSRNQGRKNIPDFCKAWKKFKLKKGTEKCKFWPHMMFRDPMGWNLNEIFSIFSMWDDLYCFREVANAETNVELCGEDTLMKIYNACDCHVLLGGEGWGLPTLEAMACGRACINIDHSANTELTEGRGELVKVAHYATGIHSTERPYPDVDDLAQKMYEMYFNIEQRKRYEAKARTFAEKLTWDNALEMWDKLLKEVKNPLSHFKLDKVK